MVISAEASSRLPPDPSSPQPAAPPSSRRDSTQGYLHDFSFPSLKPWAKHRVFRCASVTGKDEIVSGRMESSEVSGTTRIPALVGGGGGRGEDDSGLEEVREKLMVHLREAADRMNLVAPSPSSTPAAPKGAETKRAEEAGAEAEIVSARPWNLRKRRGSARVTMGIDRYLVGGGWSPEKRSVRMRSEDAEQRERPKFSITLTKEEIEEDVYAVTGRRARRRPRRRTRVVQKQLDALFPGSWLAEITVDTYKVPEQK